MTPAPWVMAKPGRAWSRPGDVVDSSLGWRFTNPAFAEHDRAVEARSDPRRLQITLAMGETAEEIAALDGIERAECDDYAWASHRRALDALTAGRFDGEIVPVVVPSGARVETGEGPRRDSSRAALASLRPAFRPGGVVTAGNRSPLSDGLPH